MDKMKKALMIVAIIALVAIAGSLVYYFVFFKPENARVELRLQEKLQEDKIKQEQVNKEKLKQALDELDNWYKEGIDSIPKDAGLEEMKIMIDVIETRYKAKRENIYKLYCN
jgi:regulator of replication initiation timing